MTAESRPGDIPALDGLRGIAVLLVIAFHSQITRDYNVVRVLTGGWAGVDIFFVLSGYLITSGLVTRSKTGGGLKPFYARRLRRLGPAALVLMLVWLLVALTGVVPVIWPGHPHDISKVLLTIAPVVGLLTLSYNWWAATSSPNPLGMGQLWSLTIEEQFYLVWPFLLGIAFRRPERAPKRLLVGLAVAAAVALGFTLWASASPHRSNLAYFGTPTRMFGLIVGAAVALLHANARNRGVRLHRLRMPARVVALASVVYVGFVAARQPPTATYLVPVISVAVAVVVWVAVTDEKVGNTWFRWGWLRWCGRRSYALYLWHPLCLLEFQHLMGVSWQSSVESFGVACGCAAVSWRLVERRFLVRHQVAKSPAGELWKLPAPAAAGI